jgi:hypothetical protein
MDVKRFVAVAALLSITVATGEARAGWNYGSRSNCRVFAKYRVEVHAAYSTNGGGSGTVNRDTGCTYAHAGPARYYTGSGLLLAEAEGYIGNSAFWGYAHAWDHWDTTANLNKHGIAGTPPEEATARTKIPGTDIPSPASIQSARNHFFSSDMVFEGASAKGRKHITIKNVTAHFVGTRGYSLLDIQVWRPADDLAKKVPDTTPTDSKTVWHSRAVVHDGRLSVEGGLSPQLFTASKPTETDKEVVYSIDNKDITIDLPATVNLDEVEVLVRGDAGDESILHPKRP